LKSILIKNIVTKRFGEENNTKVVKLKKIKIKEKEINKDISEKTEE